MAEATSRRRRRGHGEGSIFHRRDGTWVAEIDLGRDPEGKRQRRTYYGKTRREVAGKLAAAQEQTRRGQVPAGRPETVGQYLRAWLETRAASGHVRPSTLDFYAKKLAYVLPTLGTTRLDKLTRTDVDRLLVALRTRGLSARTAGHVRAVLRNALRRAVVEGQLPRNPASDAEPPALPARADTIRVLDPAEAGRLIRAARKDRLGSMTILALSTGMRMGEILGLRWQDLDLAAGSLQVSYALQRVDGRLTLVPPKTERSRRTIPLPVIAVDALDRQRERWYADQLAAGGHWRGTVGQRPGPADSVFTNVNGGPLSPERAWHAFKRLLRSAGLPETIRFHDLRHSAASLLLASGVPMREVADVLGHSSTALLGSTYGHVVPSLRRSARVMDNLLGDTH